MVKKWIQEVLNPKHKGELRKKLGAKKGEPISAKKLKKAEHSKNPTTARQARMAETLKKLHKGKKK